MAGQADYEARVSSIEVRLARLEERIVASRTALDLQAPETNRRLEELNHAGRTRDRRDQQFIGIDKFDGLEREFYGYRDVVNKTLHDLEGRASGAGKARSNLFQVVGVALVAAGLAVAIVVAFMAAADSP